MKKYLGLLFILISSHAFSQGESVRTFDEVWKELYQKSYQQKSSELDKEASELSLERAKRHWLPRAYVSGQWFSSNDPGQVFFNHLGQRSIEQADFQPSHLNRPGRESFKMGSLGVDLPLYEGGMKDSQASMLDSLLKASVLEMKAKKTEEYSELSRQYGNSLLHSKNSELLKDLKLKLAKIISSYQVGAQSNPVGYSGLLGLKGVSNRIEGLLFEFDMKLTHSQQWINSKIESSQKWRTDSSQSLQHFLNAHLSSTSSLSYSTLMMAQDLKVKTLDSVKEMEKSRFLPRVGLFAQNNIYDGKRDSETSQAYGLYLMWDLFNSDSYGRVGEANAKALSAKAKLNAHKQDEKIALEQLGESKVTLEKNLALLDDSDKLLKEQAQTAMKLFRSGMLSALQLAEVINRRVDLIENKTKAEIQYLDVYSRIYQLNN